MRVDHDRIQRILAPNPGPMTLTGTNTWLVPGRVGTIVIDPGPDSAAHREAILRAAGRIELILLTHRHHDHRDAAPELADRSGAPVRGLDPAYCRDAAPLSEGERIADLEVISTPGHTDDSLCLHHHGAAVVFTGDTVLGAGTTVITHPEGDLGAYLASLDRLIGLCRTGVRRLLPGHGPQIDDPLDRLEHYRQHRLDRLEQVRTALVAGARTVEEVTAAVYRDLDPALAPAARQSVAAQLDYLSGPASPPAPHRGW